jgi:chromosome segregation ATPase
MTTRREVPIATDTLGWVHNELAEIKSRLAMVAQAADQSRGLATDASEVAQLARSKVASIDGIGPIMEHLQDDLRAVREQLVRAQDDIHSLRQSREEIERRALADTERVRQDRNEIGRRFGEIEHAIEGWFERVTSYEEHGRRNLEVAAQLEQRLEGMAGQLVDADTLQARTQSAVGRIDNDVQRLAAMLPALQREDDVHRERSNTAFEMLRRLETELEGLKTTTNRISRLDDRIELVQAERTRHNERLNEVSAELAKIDGRLNEFGERMALVEVRIGGYQEELRALKGRLDADREAIGGYLHSLSELEADMRKRAIIALEKEIRDIRGRALNFAEE